MAISTDQKLDYLWKKLGYGRSKTDIASIKDAVNESISSPLLLRGDNIWAQSNLIPNTIPGSSTSIVTVYPTSAPVQCTVDVTSSTNRTWKTNIIDWIPPELGSTYVVKVYVHTTGQAGSAASSGTQLFAAGSGNNDEWFFDYQSGTLNFIGTNLPSGVNFSGKSVYISGAVYSGIKGTVPPGAGTTLTTADIQFLTVSGIATINNIDTNNATIDYLSGINLSYSGIGTIVTLDGTTADFNTLSANVGIITTAGITTANITNGYLQNSYVNTGIITTLSGTNLNYSGIGTIVTLDGTTADFNTLSVNTGVITTLGITTANIASGYLENSYINTGIITTLSGTNLNYTGISTIATLDGTTADFNTLSVNTGVITTLGVTTANISNVYNQNSYINTGIITTLSGTDLSYSGIGTIETLDTTTGSIDYLSGTNLNYSGISTIATLDGTTADFNTLSANVGIITTVGITTANIENGYIQNSYINVGVVTTLIGTDINYSGVGTVATLDSTTATLITANITTGIITTLTGSNLNYSGIGTIETLDGTTADFNTLSVNTGVITTLGITTANIENGYLQNSYVNTGIITTLSGTNLNYTGIGTITTLDGTTADFNTLSVNTGIITTLGVTTANVTDGYLQNSYVNTGIVTTLSGTNLNYSGIGTITTLDGATADFNTLSANVGIITTAGITTANIENAYLQNSYVNTGIITTLSGTDLSYSGIGTIETLDTTTGSIDYLSGNNISYSGIGTIETLDTSIGTIDNLSATNVSVSGIVTASQFHTGAEGSSIRVTSNSITGPSTIIIDPSGIGDDTGAVRIKGDLFVDGTQTVINSTTIELADFNVGIATTVGTNLLLDGAGIGIGSTNIRKTLTYDYSSDSLKSSENVDLASGKVYKINETEVLSSTQLTVANISSSGIGTIETLDTTTGTIDYLSGTNVNYSGIGTVVTLNSTTANLTTANITTANIVSGIVTTLSGTNLNYTGVGTIASLDSTIGTVDTLSGNNLSYTNGNFVTGVVTTISGTNINYSGIGTIETLDTTTGTIDYLSGTNVSYSGIGTIETLDTTTGTIDFLSNTNINVSGIGTIATLNTTNGTITNLSGTIGTITTLDSTTASITNLSGTDINYSGIGTIATLNSDTGTITNLAGTSATITTLSGTTVNYTTGYLNAAYVNTGIITTLTGTDLNYSGVGTIGTINNTNLNVSGVGTFVNLKIGTGVTISNGIVSATTFYGNFDGELNELGKTYYVASTGNDSNTGTNINQPFLTIAQALSVATNGDIINISAGIYEEVAPLTVPRGVTLKGSGLRATTIKPTDATKTNNIFLLNDISTVEDFTITGSYYNSTNDTGYAFAYAPGIAITTRSPYIQRITVLNKGSVTSFTDPYGYNTADSPPTSYIAGRGAKVDGSLVAGNSLEAGMLFNEVTFFTPNNTGIILTNGARAEYLNCFHYFASQAIVGVAGSVGIGSTANARIKVSGLSTSLVVNDVIKQFNGFGTAVAIGTVYSYDAPYVTITGKGSGIFTSVGIGTTQDIRVFQSDGTTQIGFASALSFVDYKMFGAEMRSVGCAVEYGAEGVVGDGVGVQLRLFATNFNHVGAGKDFTNDDTLVIQANEVIELNGGQVSYVSIDQAGDFRVGDALYINQETGTVSFAATSYDLSVLGNLTVTDGVSNTTTITPTSLTVGNLQLSANTFSSTSGDINIDPGGSSETNVSGNLNVSGILTASVLQTSALQIGDTSIALDDTGSDGTIRINTDGLEAMRVTNSQRVAIGTDVATSKFNVAGNSNFTGIVTATGAINSSTDVQIDGVSVLTTASADAVALAIALG